MFFMNINALYVHRFLLGPSIADRVFTTHDVSPNCTIALLHICLKHVKFLDCANQICI